MKYNQGKYNSDVYNPAQSSYTKETSLTTVFHAPGDFGVDLFGVGLFGIGGADFTVPVYSAESLVTTIYTPEI